MKLAEGLVLRADAQRRMEQLKQRVLRVAKVQEGDVPAEDPQALLREFEAVSKELVRLIQRINSTNSQARFQDGSLTDALARRDILKLREACYRELAQAAVITQSRMTKSEVKFKTTVSIAQVQKQADALAGELRDLDARIQEANWQIELSE